MVEQVIVSFNALRKRDWLFALVIGGLIGSLMSSIAPFLAHDIDKTPPIEGSMKVEALNSPIKQGGDLCVRITRNKVRDDCPVTSLRYVTNKDGKATDIPDRAWIGGPTGDRLDTCYPTSGLPPDDYTLHVSLSYGCPGFVYNRDQPTVKFRVIE